MAPPIQPVRRSPPAPPLRRQLDQQQQLSLSRWWMSPAAVAGLARGPSLGAEVAGNWRSRRPPRSAFGYLVVPAMAAARRSISKQFNGSGRSA
ncbi:MAG: hypothetical protein U5L11_10105 [Arhodomonas sp.]|nr:hypothetical protein [Arhodomonas sp.]